MKIEGGKVAFKGELVVPGDKSISHRAIMLGSIAKGKTIVENFLFADDCLNTIKCFEEMGVNIEFNNDKVIVHGVGLHGLKSPKNTLYVGNSGTTIRLLSGILAAQDFECEITGDDSIKKRPMDRVIIPLTKMGANVIGINNMYPPIKFKRTNKINGLTYNQHIASAQVKSCILLAGLYSNEKIEVIQKSISRDHTERMLKYLGANVVINGNKVTLTPGSELIGKRIYVPGDISSASFFIVGSLILDKSELVIKNVGINKTRIGIINVLKRMNGNITIYNKREVNNEEIGDIIVKSSELKGTIIEGDEIPKLIDEIPIIAVAASQANGVTIIKDAKELKFKESNRISTTVTELKKMGVNIEEIEDGMIIRGGNNLIGANLNSHNDHRIAMSLIILALKSKGKTYINNIDCIKVSFPSFFEKLKKLTFIQES